jgi:hypothetical protein
LSASHARAILHLPNCIELAQIIAKGPGARRRAPGGRRKRSASLRRKRRARKMPTPRRSSATWFLGLKIEIASTAKGGALTIHYQTLEQLDDRRGLADPGLLPVWCARTGSGYWRQLAVDRP